MHALCALALAGLAPACIEESQRISDTAGTSDTADSSFDAPVGEPCDEPGITRCAADAAATEICLDGVWQRAACAENKICVLAGGAQCVDSTGDEDCRDTLYCFLACQITYPDDTTVADACFVECFRSATQAAQRELSDVTSCFEENCPEASGFECAAERCSQDLADCYFESKGETGCGAILECRVACKDDEVCAKACGNDGTIEAQGDYAVLELCLFFACAGKDEDCPKRAALPTGACGAYTNACIGLLPNTPR